MSTMQERAARAVLEVRIGPFGPNTRAAFERGGTTLLTQREAEEIAAAVLAVAADVNEIAMALHGPFCAFPQDCSGAGYGDYLRAEAVAAHLLDRP